VRRRPSARKQLEKNPAALSSHSQGSGRDELCGEQGESWDTKGQGARGDTTFKVAPGQR